MTLQAQNCLRLYFGGNPATIRQLLKHQKQSVVTELMNHFNTTNLDRLAIHLSNGK